MDVSTCSGQWEEEECTGLSGRSVGGAQVVTYRDETEEFGLLGFRGCMKGESPSHPFPREHQLKRKQVDLVMRRRPGHTK